MSRTTHDLPDHLAAHVSPETEYFGLAEELDLQRGGRLPAPTIAYQTWGDRRNAERTVLICHALTGSADVDAWWPGVIGAEGAFDPARDFIVCSNIIGSCYGSTGPASPMPGADDRYRSRFPRITVRDMVEAQRLLLDHLGVEAIDVITGPSLGGMQALEWALQYPDRVRSIVPIGVGGRHSPWCIGMSEAQRNAIYADPNWNDGDYSDESPPDQGLSAARMMAVCSYRSWGSFESRFGRERRDEDRYQVQSYLQHQGRKITERFDANTYVRLTQAMNDYDVSEGRGEYLAVLKRIRQPAMVVSVSSDVLYPPEEQRILAENLPNASYEVLDSIHGHDGFLIQSEELAGKIRQFRETLEGRPALVDRSRLSAAQR